MDALAPSSPRPQRPWVRSVAGQRRVAHRDPHLGERAVALGVRERDGRGAHRVLRGRNIVARQRSEPGLEERWGLYAFDEELWLDAIFATARDTQAAA